MTYAPAAHKAGRARALVRIEEESAIAAPAASSQDEGAQQETVDIANARDVDACDLPPPPPYEEADQYETLDVEVEEMEEVEEAASLECMLSGATLLGCGGQAAAFALACGDTVLKVGYATGDEEANQIALQLSLAHDRGIRHPAALLPTDAFAATLDGTFPLPDGATLPGAPRMWHHGMPLVVCTLMPLVRGGETLAELCQKLDYAEGDAQQAQRRGDADAALALADVREAREDGSYIVLRDLVPLLVEMAQAGVLHGDIKLENVMMDEDLGIKLIDWGLCSTFDPTQARRMPARLCGTLEYLAPEVLHAEAGSKPCALSAAQDMWALGVMLVKLLSGQHLHPYFRRRDVEAVRTSLTARGQQDNMHHWAAALSRLLRRCPPGPRWPAGVREQLSPALVEVVEGLLQQDPARRMGLQELQAKVRGLMREHEAPAAATQQAAAAAEPSAAAAVPVAAPAMLAPSPAPPTPGSMAPAAASKASAVHRPAAAPACKAGRELSAPPPPGASPSPLPLPRMPEACNGSPSLSCSYSCSIPYHSASSSMLSSASSSGGASSSMLSCVPSTTSSVHTPTALPQTSEHSGRGRSFVASSTSPNSSCSPPCSGPPAPSTPDRISDHGVPAPSTPERNSSASLGPSGSPCLPKADRPGTSAACPAAADPTTSCKCRGGCDGVEGARAGTSAQQNGPRKTTVWSRITRRWLASLGACWGRA